MRALMMEGFGDPHELVLGDMPAPVIGRGDLLVRVGAVSINPVDWKEIGGMLKDFYPPYPSPWVPGFDGSGIVEQVGDDVSGFAPGERVLIRPDRSNGNGVLAEYAKVSEGKAAKAHEGLTHPQIACMATALRTAFQALQRPDVGILQTGQSVLVDGASGGVGSYAVALARTLGARVCGTCRPANADYVRSIGAELVLSYEQKDLLAQLRVWMSGGIDVILDCHSGGQKTEMLDVLAPEGRLIALATLNNDGDVQTIAALARAKEREFHFLLLDYETLVQDIASINSILARGMFAMPDITVFPLERAAEALQAVKRGGIRGKIVVEIAKLL